MWALVLQRIAIFALLSLMLPACSAAPALTSTTAPTLTPVPVTVRQLIDNNAMYTGKKVQLVGTVILECSSGCWFFLDDGTALIYIDLNARALNIPQKVGSRVVLVGEPSGSGGTLRILAEAVQFPD